MGSWVLRTSLAAELQPNEFTVIPFVSLHSILPVGSDEHIPYFFLLKMLPEPRLESTAK